MFCFLLALVHWVVDPMSSVQRLPDAEPTDGERGGCVRIVAARDEYEPGSFVVRGDADERVTLTPSRFVTSDGQSLPPEAIDLKIVKVWYQNRNAWFSYFGDNGWKLCPELLLNDEDLLRVDESNQANYARLTEADGRVHERWINPPKEFDRRQSRLHHRMSENFESMRQNFRDAATLQPVRLEKGRYKQFFLTVHVTPDVRAGVYRGTIKIRKGQETREEGHEGCSIPVEVRVLDFTLPEPRTYGDLSKPFRVGFYNYLSFHYLRMRNGDDEALAREQLVPILRNYRAHNVSTFIVGDSAFSSNGKYTIDEMRKAGLDPTALLFVSGEAVRTGNGHDIVTKHIRHGGVEEAVIRRQAAAVTRLLGHRNIMVSYGDEPIAKTILPMRDAWKAYQDWGFKTFIAGNAMCFHKTGHVFDWFNTSHEPTDGAPAVNWNATDTESVAWYANQHVGAEDPSLSRRQNGLGAWLSGYTALCNYALHLGDWNDDSVTYRPMVYAYGIGNGLVDTLQWEGFREGVDDIRYATLLAALAREAAKHGDAKIRRQGRLSLKWFVEFDRARDSLTAGRSEMIRQILALKTLLGHEAVLPAQTTCSLGEPEADISQELAADLAACKGGAEEMAKVYEKYYMPERAYETLVASNCLLSAARMADGVGKGEEGRAFSRQILADPKANPDARVDRFVDMMNWDLPFALRREQDVLGNTVKTTNAVFTALTRAVAGVRRFYDGRRPAAEARVRIIRETGASLKKPVPVAVWQYAQRVALCEGDYAAAAKVAEAALATPEAEKFPPETRWQFAFVSALGRGRDFAVVPAGDVSAARRLEAIDDIGSSVMRAGDEELVRRLMAYRTSLFTQRPRRRYEVAFSPKRIRSAQDWPTVEASPMDRQYQGNVEVLATDVATGSRAVGTDGDENAPVPTLGVVADDWGLHFKYDCVDESAADIAAGTKPGFSFEGYIAPGLDYAHSAIMVDVGRETKLTMHPTSYDNAAYRRPDARLHPNWQRVETVFGKNRVTVYVSLSWEMFAFKLPKDGDVWDFENMCWGGRGKGNAWNGTASIHGHSTWGELVFRLSPADRTAILREQLFAARAAYLAEKDPYKFGILDYWEDFDIGDNAFYLSSVKPLVDRLDRELPNMKPDMSDAEVERIAASSLQPWLSVRAYVQKLRTDWLRKYPDGVVPVAERRTTLRPVSGTVEPAEPEPIAVKKGTPLPAGIVASNALHTIDGWNYLFYSAMVDGRRELRVARSTKMQYWEVCPKAVVLPATDGLEVLSLVFSEADGHLRVTYGVGNGGSETAHLAAECTGDLREYCEAFFL